MCSVLDFVHVARNLFSLQLDEADVGAHEISSILNSQISQETGDSLETDEMEKLKHERNNALEQVKTLKVISNLASLYFLLYKEKKENYLVLNSGVSRLSVCFFKEYQYQIA